LLNKLNFGTIKRVSDTLSKFVVNNFELKYILVPLFLMNNLYFLTENRIDQSNLLLYTIENNIKKKNLGLCENYYQKQFLTIILLTSVNLALS
jgi:hypothetical protein